MYVLTLEPVKPRLFDAMMIHNKSMIHYLLIICIAMAPVLTVDASAAGHMESMSTDHIDCDMNGGAGHGHCDNTRCMLSSGVCGTHASGYIAALSWMPTPVLPFVENHPSSASRFRSRLVSSIYRPPIF
jgi:hypothetical protein